MQLHTSTKQMLTYGCQALSAQYVSASNIFLNNLQVRNLLPPELHGPISALILACHSSTYLLKCAFQYITINVKKINTIMFFYSILTHCTSSFYIYCYFYPNSSHNMMIDSIRLHRNKWRPEVDTLTLTYACCNPMSPATAAVEV